MKYIGIDLAWTYKNKTGVCIFDNKECIMLEAEVYTDEDLIRLIHRHQPCVVSIDAPLRVDNESGGRTVDSILMKTKINGHYLKLYASSKKYMTRVFSALRGVDIRSQLGSMTLGKDLLETFPTGIYLSLFPDLYLNKYKLSSRLKLADLLNHAMALATSIQTMGFTFDLELDEVKTKKAYKDQEDKLDAVLCAVNSFYHHHESSSKFEDESGCIVLANHDHRHTIHNL